MFGKKSVIVRVEAQIVWKFGRDPDDGSWLAVCDELNLTAIGDTWMDLQECANEAMGLLLVDLFEDGELQTFLAVNGWQLQTPLPARGEAKPSFDIPFSLERTSSIEELVTA